MKNVSYVIVAEITCTDGSKFQKYLIRNNSYFYFSPYKVFTEAHMFRSEASAEATLRAAILREKISRDAEDLSCNAEDFVPSSLDEVKEAMKENIYGDITYGSSVSFWVKPIFIDEGKMLMTKSIE